MPVLWGNHNNSQIFINVAILTAAEASIVRQGGAPSNPVMFRALIDTGATVTCITKNVAQKLAMQPIGKVPIQGAGGAQFHNNYLFNVGFLIQDQSNPTQVTTIIHMLDTAIQGAEFDSGGKFDVLVGMDVISTGTLMIGGNGSFTWAW